MFEHLPEVEDKEARNPLALADTCHQTYDGESQIVLVTPNSTPAKFHPRIYPLAVARTHPSGQSERVHRKRWQSKVTHTRHPTPVLSLSPSLFPSMEQVPQEPIESEVGRTIPGTCTYRCTVRTYTGKKTDNSVLAFSPAEATWLQTYNKLYHVCLAAPYQHTS